LTLPRVAIYHPDNPQKTRVATPPNQGGESKASRLKAGLKTLAEGERNMKAEQKKEASDSHPARDDFITYPLHKVVSVFKSQSDVDAVLAELRGHGFKDEDIEAFCGVEGEKRIDFRGVRHGTLATILRTAQHIGPDRTYLERYEQKLSDGHCMVLVKVRNAGRKESAARIMHGHTKERVTYFGFLVIDELK
jgi:hypothetical protein